MAVLVTRPDERGKALVDQLNQAGVVALHLPLLSIEAGAELAQLPTKLNQLKVVIMCFWFQKVRSILRIKP